MRTSESSEAGKFGLPPGQSTPVREWTLREKTGQTVERADSFDALVRNAFTQQSSLLAKLTTLFGVIALVLAASRAAHLEPMTALRTQ